MMEWLRENWKALAFLFGVIAAIVFGRKRWAGKGVLVPSVSEPDDWAFVPGSGTEIIVRNPDTGKAEMLELPDGVKADSVTGVGLSHTKGRYEVETIHEPIDRRAMLHERE